MPGADNVSRACRSVRECNALIVRFAALACLLSGGIQAASLANFFEPSGEYYSPMRGNIIEASSNQIRTGAAGAKTYSILEWHGVGRSTPEGEDANAGISFMGSNLYQPRPGANCRAPLRTQLAFGTCTEMSISLTIFGANILNSTSICGLVRMPDSCALGRPARIIKWYKPAVVSR